MIELKDITFQAASGSCHLQNYSLQVSDGTVCQLPLQEGLCVIELVLGFVRAESGYVSIDGATINERSASFLRKNMAYVPEPEGFEGVVDLQQKQLEMITTALQKDADILLLVNPFSHQSEAKTEELMAALEEKAQQGACVIIATDGKAEQESFVVEIDDNLYESENI